MATLNFSPKEKEEAFDLLFSVFYQLDFAKHEKADFELTIWNQKIAVWKHV